MHISAVNGQRQWLNCRNNTREENYKWIELLKGQNGESSALRLRKMWHTDLPSIQGPWTPFTHKHPELNLVIFPNEKLSIPLNCEQTATEQLMELFKKQKLESNDNLDYKRAE